MKLNKIFALMLGVFALASCSNDNDPAVVSPVEAKGPHAVTVTLKAGSTTKSLDADGTQVGKCAPVNKINLFIADADGIIYTKDLGVTTGITNATASTNVFEKTYLGLPAAATTVYVIANNPAAVDYSACTTLTQVKALQYTVESQNIQANAADVVLEGSGPAVENGAPVNNVQNYKANVILVPAVARMEISAITAKTGSKIASFKIDKVFLNSYFAQMNFPAIVSATPTLNIPTDGTATDLAANALPAVGDPDFYITKFPADGLFPASNIVGYNFFAGALPHILVRLTDITYNTGTVGLPTAWITIKAYKKDGTTSISLSERGKVYIISNIEFDETQIGPNPYDKNISITAVVKVQEWEGVSLTPEL